MDASTQVSSKRPKEKTIRTYRTARAFKSTQMAASTMDVGKTANVMVRARICIPMVIFTRGSSKTTKQRAMAFTPKQRMP